MDLIDDYKGLGVKIRLIAQIAAGLIMAEFAHIKIIDLGNLLGFGDIHLDNYTTVSTLVIVVVGINAFNMIDGIDGLAGCLILFSFSTGCADFLWCRTKSNLRKFSIKP